MLKLEMTQVEKLEALVRKVVENGWNGIADSTPDALLFFQIGEEEVDVVAWIKRMHQWPPDEHDRWNQCASDIIEQIGQRIEVHEEQRGSDEGR